MDPLAARLRATFLAELEEQIRVMNADLLVLEREPTNAERLKSLFRVAHTLKGASRAAGVPLMEQACHALESLLAKARDGKQKLDAKAFVVLFAAADAMADARLRLAQGHDLAGSPLEEVVGALTGGRKPPERRPQAVAAARAAGEPVERQEGGAQIRIDGRALDAVLAATTNLRQAWSRVSARTAELHSATGFAGDVRALAQAVDEVSGGVVRLRMRPFAEICEALPRMVRDLAAEERKDVRLVIQGGEVEADRSVLDAVREPIVHLVRNAISHGIEEPAIRLAARKPKQATLTVAAALRGGRFLVTVSDDGAGLDTVALRRARERLGRPVPGDDAELARVLFEGGISTRTEATVIAGRGVGLDVVRAAVERMNGAAQVQWHTGEGSTFTLDCPITLASIRVLLVRVGTYTLGIPTAAVERVLRIRPDAIMRAEGRDVLTGPDGALPVVSLARVLGPPYVEHAVAGATPVVQLLVGGRRLAVVVDELVDECEVTIRPLTQRRALPLLSGAAVIATGGAAPVLNGAAIVAAGLRASSAELGSLRADPGAAAPQRRVLVVDDSITTRTLEQSVLHAAGYDVLTAVDGADAWRVLQEQPCDLVVSDVEMPRMDGFALCEAIRSSPRFAKLPVVLVTALETAEQRARGMQAGADAYLGKSSFDQQTLLDVVRQFLE